MLKNIPEKSVAISMEMSDPIIKHNDPQCSRWGDIYLSFVWKNQSSKLNKNYGLFQNDEWYKFLWALTPKCQV